jgi:sugar phosphate isomerase/epimerase
MRLPNHPSLHLTYCQNIHPGESWAEHFEALRTKATAVRDALEIKEPFGLGLRLSAQAAAELASQAGTNEATALFASENLYPFSINGFPFGRFHRGPVKENVYAPDWKTPERLHYTLQLADQLAQWLPPGIEGSISTVPGSFAPWIHTEADELAMAAQLGHLAAHLARLERQSGRRIHVGLEPEPDCFLETTAETIEFFKTNLPAGALPILRQALDLSDSAAEELLRRHLGVCFDTCHAALQFEDLADSLLAYQDAGILISKIQLSAALSAPANAAAYEALRAFSEPIYLHQVKARTASGGRVAWKDLPLALPELGAQHNLEELRVHFHVPLFVSPKLPLRSTAFTLDSRFWELVRGGICPHLEIETYTFDVLPPEVHPGDLIHSIAAEYRWVLQNLEPHAVIRD